MLEDVGKVTGDFGPPELTDHLLEPDFGRVTEVKISIWLILPVVICLSQRLSHACLSINSIQ